jgi:hypothetical protein
LNKFFLDPVWLFRIPAVALIGGITFVTFFILNTNRKVAAEKARRLADEQKKVQ